MSQRDLDLYDRYFTVVPADTPELLDAAHELRYQVYCREHAFENPADHPGGREVDVYDASSVHAVLIQRAGDRVVGWLRLILPGEGGVAQLPLRQLVSGEAAERLDACDPLRTAEISRYAVSKALRRREGEELYPDVPPAGQEEDLPVADLRRLAPHLSVGLLRGVATLAAAQGVTTLCAAMAPALLRLVKRFGFRFHLLGPPIEYHGVRQPCIADCEELLAELAQRESDYFELVAQAYRAK